MPRNVCSCLTVSGRGNFLMAATLSMMGLMPLAET